MNARAATSWQTILADLAMILFMVTASALSDPAAIPPPPKPAPPTPPPTPPQLAASVRAEPVGVWREGPGGPALAEWVAQQGADPRLRATVLVRDSGDAVQALDHAGRLVAALGARKSGARVVVEPANGANGGATVTLGYDAEAVAR
ncbi:hypothetical protein [Novosphingobium percolationis]|uniref:hypothetical protein n=1 Tax=Novosphingobium percolationis TaxID=2871811 RepID=UPI001CD67F37|nr:hypothetical protein [Novosphingobium percolationis]